jgi:hypothetical protein
MPYCHHAWLNADSRLFSLHAGMTFLALLELTVPGTPL